MQQKVLFSAVVFLLSTVFALLVWNAWEIYHDYRSAQMQVMQNSTWSAANEVANYIKQLQSSVKMFVANESQLLYEVKAAGSIETSSFFHLQNKILLHYPDAVNFLIWNKDGTLVIDSDGTQIDKPEIYQLPSIGKEHNEYAVRMHHSAEFKHFNIVIPWVTDNQHVGVFGLSFPSELIQPLLTDFQSVDHQLVLWKHNNPGFIEFLSSDSELNLVRDLYLDEEDMRRVGTVATVLGTDWDVVSLHRPDLFTNKLKQVVLSGIYKFLILFVIAVIAYVLYREDLKRRFEASEKIRKHEERLQLALESTQDGIWEVDYKSGDFFFNERWYEMLGYNQDELNFKGNLWDTLIHKDDLQDVKKTYEAHLAGDTDNYDHEHRLKHKSGKWIWVHDRGRVLEWDGDGKPLRAVGTSADITVRKSAEISLRRNEEAMQSFYSIISVVGASLHNQIQCLLAIGCRHLRMKCGILSYVEGDRYTVMHVYATSPEYKIQTGDKFDLGITYCQFTLQQQTPVGFAHAKTTDIATHPAYQTLQLEAYLGSPVFLDGDTYGTLNFSSIEARDEEFTESEKYFVQLMAEWISNKLQSQYSKQRQEEASQALALHLENAPTATIEWNSQGKIKRWSKRAEEILGWEKKEVIGKTPQEWPVRHHNQTNELVKLHAVLTNNIEESLQFSFELSTDSGEICHSEWFATKTNDIFNREVSYLAIIQDVTEKVHAQQELMRSQARLHDLYDNAPDMYFSIDAAGKIQSANQFCADYLGYTKDELLNKPYWNLLHQNDIRRARRHINVVFHDQINEFEMEVRILNKNGEVINTHQRLRLIAAHEGLPRELRILCRDITQRATSQQERLEHMKVQRDELGREMRHRIKNNLQAIVGLLKVNLDAYPELENVLVTSINQVDTIAIVNNLMIDSERRLVNLIDLVSKITRASSKLFSQEASFEVLCKNKDFIELWEEETIAVSLIISELITNAMKHRTKSIIDSDCVRIKIEDDPLGLAIEVANAVDTSDNQEFDINEKSKQGGVGLGMVQSLMPPEGAELEIRQHSNFVYARLILNSPVLLDFNSAEVEILEAIS